LDAEAPPPPPRRPRWHPVARALLFLLLFLALQVGAALAVGSALVLTGVALSAGESTLLVFAVTAPLLVLATRPFLRFFDRRGLASLGARWPVGGRGAAVRQAIAAPLAAVALLAAWLGLLALLPGAAVRFEGGAGERAGGLRLAALLAGFLVQGGLEEWLVRGYIYRALRERWRTGTAVLASSFLFAALHGLNPDFSPAALVNTFLAGVIFAFLVERSGSLWSATLAHGAWNFAVSCLFALPVSGVRFPHWLALSVDGPALLTGGGFGPEGSLLLTLLALPLVLVCRPPAADVPAYPGEAS
jgi:membrane protease YdiL (CAAX protease family)